MNEEKNIKELGEIAVECMVRFDDYNSVCLSFYLNDEIVLQKIIDERELLRIFGIDNDCSEETLLEDREEILKRLRDLGYL